MKAHFKTATPGGSARFPKVLGLVFRASGLLALVALHAFAASVDLDIEKLDRQCRPSVVIIKGDLLSGEGSVQGTGFVISADGQVVTNHHVIAGATRLTAVSADGTAFHVKAIVADDSGHDLAVLLLDNAHLPALPLADENTVQRGSRVVVIGNPLGLEGSITEGIVSAIRQDGPRGLVYQITVPISHGSSGSPVLNAQGQVIGVATFMLVSGQALNFAGSVHNLKDLLAHPTVPPVPLGPADPVVPDDRPTAETKKQDAEAARDPQFARLRDLEKAHTYSLMLEAARDLVKRFPESALARRRLFDAYDYTAFFEDALAACYKARELDPQNARGWNDLAIVAAQMKDREAEMNAYREGLKAAPTDAKLWLEYGERVGAVDSPAGLDAIHTAITLLKEGKGTDLESSTYPLFTMAANGLLDLGKLEEAYETALLGVRQTPKDPDAWISMASCALAMKKYPHVWPYLQQAISTGGPPDVLYGILAESEQEQGHTQQALEALQHAYQANALNKNLLIGLVRIFLSRATLDQAQWTEVSQYVAQLTRLDPKLGQSALAALQQEFQHRRQPEAPVQAPPPTASAPPAPPVAPVAPPVTVTESAPKPPSTHIERSYALNGSKNTILDGPNPSQFTPEEMPIVQGLRFGQVELPERKGLTYYKMTVFIDNASPKGVLEKVLQADVRVLCVDADGALNVTKYTKDFDIASRGTQQIDLGGKVSLQTIRTRNNNAEIPKNAYVAFKYNDKVIYEVLLGNFGEPNWWQRNELIRK